MAPSKTSSGDVQYTMFTIISCWVFLMLSADFFFSKSIFSKSFLGNTIGESNCLDPDQDRRSVGLVLDPNCLQRYKRYTAEDKIRRWQAHR